jgi:hypothetical protein
MDQKDRTVMEAFDIVSNLYNPQIKNNNNTFNFLLTK